MIRADCPFSTKHCTSTSRKILASWLCQSINRNSFSLKHYHGQHNRICLTDTLLPMVVNWFHNATAHNSGITRLQETLRFHFYHPKLLAEVCVQIPHYDICQHMKRGSRQYGLLAPCDTKSAPWSNVATDCIGPWVIELCGVLKSK